MKPFNLEEAKAGKPVCTRDGKDVRILCFDRQAPSPIVGLVYAEGIGEFCCIFNANGEAEDADMSNDLFMKPEKHEGWGWASRLSPCSKVSMFAQIYETEEEALSCKPDCECFLAKIEWEE